MGYASVSHSQFLHTRAQNYQHVSNSIFPSIQAIIRTFPQFPQY